MPPSKTRYVTACQQILALGVVLAALTPAASVISLDVVRETPSSGSTGAAQQQPVATLSAYVKAQEKPSVLPAQVVDPTVTEIPLTAPAPTAGAKSATLLAGRLTANARSKPGSLPGSTEVTSVPEPVVGYGAVGVTWEHGAQVPDTQLGFQVRTRTGADWSSWITLPYDAEHAPDPDSAEGRHARPGTDPLLVGEVDQVQVRATSQTGTVPADMKLAVVDPGKATRTVVSRGALDTNTMDGSSAPTQPSALTGSIASDEGRISLSAAAYTPKPVIYSRAQWGADERMRDKSSLHYYEVHAGFVHHTVNANDYTRAEVPGIIRSIYAYHTQSKGWSDIGYNFLVDRFGRVWEGRYGGVDRPVVGAHTLNYNDYSFAMSAIGNYDIHQPSEAMVQAYGALFAWKLSLHGVNAASTKQWVGSKYFQAINGHRDAGQTACPGRYLYARIPDIRKLAAAAQRGWSGRQLESNLASTVHPDLVVRRKSDGQAFILPTGGLTQFNNPVSLPTTIAADDTVVPSPDLTGDGEGDLLVRHADGSSQVYPGTGKGGVAAPLATSTVFAGHTLVTAVGDLDGDGFNDVVARRVENPRLDLYSGNGKGGFTRHLLGTGWGGFTMLAATGDLDRDGFADLLARDTTGRLWLYRGTGTKALGGRVQVPGSWGSYDTITGFGDYSGDGRADLLVRSPGQPAYVLPSRGDGTFGHALGPITRAQSADSLLGADLTGNAAPDLLTRTGTRLAVLPNNGTFEVGAPIATGVDASGADLLMNAGDWDRDGKGDIITRNATTGSLYLRPGDGTGHFHKAVRIGTGFGSVKLLAAVGDMTGDGYPDLMGQPSGGAMRIYPGNGLSGLKPSYVAHSSIDAGKQIPIGRWDGDGAPDSLFRKGSKLTVYPGNGPGGLTVPKTLGLDLSPYDWFVGISDEQLTGHPDVLAREKATGYLWLLQATPDGFAKRRFMAEGMEAYDLAG
ncbi:MAG: FG-GAP-like repeat-containing protein [Nocardioides sp.]